MDIRKFFMVQQQKKSATEPAKNGKAKSEYDSKKRSELPKVKSLNSDDGSAKKMKQQANKKKHILIDSDSEEEVPVQKHRKPSKESSKPAHPPKKDPVVYVSETDEEDNFESLKQPLKRKENGLSASSRSGSTGRAAKVKPPAKPAPPKAVTPAKCTPTSVFDYFGDSSVQRSHKKLVATTKRTAPTGCTDDSTNEDEAIARQLQMDEDAELERQLHEDEDFARTLAILDEPPKSKKTRKDSEDQQRSASLPVKSPVKPDRATIKQEAKESDVGSKDPPPKKPSPIKASSKLTLIKQKEETLKKEVVKKTSVKEKTISPKKEEMVTPKTENFSQKIRDCRLTLIKQKEETLKKEVVKKTSVKEKTISPKKEEMVTPKTEKISPKKSESKSPEDSEKKRLNLQTYRSYLNRDGPRALGSKEVPKGADNCLEGLTFVLTGVLESMERDDAKSLIERYGGKVTGNISKKTSYVVLGRDSGVSKTEKAESLGTNILDEDGLLDLIRKQPGKRSKYEIAAQAENTPEKTTPPKRAESAKRKTPTPPKKGLSFQQKSLEKVEPPALSENKDESLLWVDRYKPTSLKNIIGQQGDQSCANKLLRWLRNWHHNTAGDKKPAAKFSKFGGKDDGSTFKAALLSGPPGVGTSHTVSNKHVLIMDEVDGMAGNEDRGGIQELIGLIKNTKIPIICMCNDRNHQKIRSLVNYCFDLRFQRPRVEQIKGAMMSVAFKEGLKVPPPALNEIILAANQDIRQVLHNLSMWSARDKVLTYDQAKSDASKARKDVKMTWIINLVCSILRDMSPPLPCRTHVSKRAVNMEYLPFLRDSLVRPMAEHGAEGVSEAVQLMDDYCLMKEDVDNIMEISTWGGRPDPFSKLDPKVKSAFTRTYNKETHLTPYTLQAVKKAKRGAGSTVDLGDEFGTEDTQPEDKESEDTIETDAMIKNIKLFLGSAHRYHTCADSGVAKTNTHTVLRSGVPSADRFFSHYRLTLQPPQSYSVGG
ncbi:UNVERIFIED_CONTAM: hypothetical protein FKN15_033129 [Acipenser sinensis]